MNRCTNCNRELLTGDFNGLCSACRGVSYNETEIVNSIKITEEHEKLKTKYKALKKDVARFFELLRKTPKHSFEEYNEWCDLHEKLSKVGKKE